MNETKDFNNNTAPKANTGKRPGAAGVAAAGLGAMAGAGATGVSMAFENGLDIPDGLDQDAIDSGTMAYNDNYSAPYEPEEDELDIEDFDPNEIVIDPSEFTDMEDTTVETDDRHLAFEPITAEDLILDPESLDIEVIDNDVLYADEPVIDAEFDVDDLLLADTESTGLCDLADESTCDPYMPDNDLADNDVDNAFGNDIIDDLMA